MPLSDDVLAAIYNKNVQALNELTAAGADINSTDEDGRTPLMHAVLDSRPDPRFIRHLLRQGATPNAADANQQWRALHYAVQAGGIDVVRVLLEAGASVDAQDAFGNTPLWRAVMAPKPSTELVELLLLSGADPTLRNHHGISPLDLAQTRGLQNLHQQLRRDSRRR
jgi:ankyrin repeat protein